MRKVLWTKCMSFMCCLFIVGGGFFIQPDESSAALPDGFFKPFQDALSSFVDGDGFVDYEGWQLEQDGLNVFIASLESLSSGAYEALSINEKKAFLINAYNAFTVHLVLREYPISSIRRIGAPFSSPWKKEFFSLMGGKIKTLDGIEHDYLRGKAELFDPRVHAVVNCASISCPVLSNRVYLPETLDQQMNEAMVGWLGEQDKNLIARGSTSIELSMIFKWYKKDFETTLSSMPSNLRGFLFETLAAHSEDFGFEGSEELRDYLINTPIKFKTYDWGLNGGKG